MHTDARTLDTGASIDADVCIIGAGAAGITIATELKDSGMRIVLLESGGFQYEDETQSLYEGESTGLPYYSLTSCRLRYFGGTTGHWSGFCAPLERMDFRKRDWIPNSGWPISYEDLEPWYQRAAAICQLRPMPQLQHYWEEQIDASAPRTTHYRRLVTTKIIRLSPPTRFGTQYRDEVLSAHDIRLLTYANVTNLQTNESGSHVEAIEVKTLNGRTLRVRAKTCVLACGALENARVLLFSRDANPAGVANQYDIVGRYFQEHPHVLTSSVVFQDANYTRLMQDRQRHFLPLLSITPEAQREYQITNYSSIIMRTTEEKPDEKSDIARGVWNLAARIEQVPNPDSRVMLSDGRKDVLGQPEIRLQWNLTHLEKKTIRVAEQLIATEFGRSQFGRLRMPDWLSDPGNGWSDALFGAPHHMGTTRMSRAPQTGVVDSNCKAYGLDNLYIAGASVFPTGGSSNPTLTIVAIAARLASHLKLHGRLG